MTSRLPGAPRHCEERQRRGKPQLYIHHTLLIFILFLTISCTTTKSLTQNELLPPDSIQWSTLKPGFEITNQKIRELGVSWTCVKIDLSLIQAEPVIAVSEKPFSVKSFARQRDLTVAVNTTQFSIEGSTVKAQGLIKAGATILSEPVQSYCALCFTADGEGKLTCAISDNQTSTGIDKYDYVIGGFFVILQDGQIPDFVQTRRSRTACGTDDTGQLLYLFAVTPDFSLKDKNGLSYPECAAILKQLGCTNAMQFDGGHSTSMVINGKNVQTPLFQRKVAAAMGF